MYTLCKGSKKHVHMYNMPWIIFKYNTSVHHHHPSFRNMLLDQMLLCSDSWDVSRNLLLVLSQQLAVSKAQIRPVHKIAWYKTSRNSFKVFSLSAAQQQSTFEQSRYWSNVYASKKIILETWIALRAFHLSALFPSCRVAKYSLHIKYS